MSVPRGVRVARPGFTVHDQAGLLASLVVLSIALTILSEYFLTVSNGLNVARAVSYWGISAAAATMVLVGGLLDLSIGSIMSLSGVVCALLLEQGTPMPVAVAAGVGCGLILGCVNGFFVGYVGINPFIVTIGTQFVFRGVAFAIAGGRAILIASTDFNEIGQGNVLGIPIPVVVLFGVFAGMAWLMRATRFGRHTYAIGGSAEAARLVGINVERRRFQLLVLSGALAGLSGVILAAYTGQGIATAGLGIELTVVTAVILGGTSLLGGRGNVLGTAIGVVLLGIVGNGVTLLGMAYYWQYVTQGGVLLLAVLVDQYRARRALT